MIVDVPTPPTLRNTPLGHNRTQSATSPFPGSESKSGVSLLKGKHKESESFNFAWWDYAPLLEGRKPPVQWTSCSVILFASAVTPAVECLHYPSNKHFTLPNPRPLLSDSLSYEPASVIVASDRDEFIFAFFPGIGVDGVGCFWRKDRSIDSWSVREWRTFARGNGVVAARWTKTEREWLNASGGESGPSRLPALGPFVPSLAPVLVVVTESHLCVAHYFHPQSDQMQEVAVSLLRRCETLNSQQKPLPEPVEGPRGFGRCTHAAIGFGYEEPSILVSTFSAEVPSAPTKDFNPVGPNLDMPLDFGMSEDPLQSSWYDMWREKNAVHVFEVSIGIKGFVLNLSASPISSVRDAVGLTQYVTDILFVPSLSSHAPLQAVPSTPTPANRNVTTPQSSPAPPHASQSPSLSRSPVKGTPPKAGADRSRKRPDLLYLLVYSVGLDHFNILKSSISMIGCTRGLNDAQPWKVISLKQFTLPSGIVMFISPWPQGGSSHANSSHTSAMVGILDTESRPASKGKHRSQIVGRLQAIRLSGSDLHFDETYPPVELVRPIGEFGVELPFNMAVSPNRSHVCSISASVAHGRHSSIVVELHPSKEPSPNSSEHAPERSKRTFTQLVEKALQSRLSPNDVVRLLPATNMSVNDIEEVLASVLSDLENSNGVSFMWTESLVGLSVDIYRTFKDRADSSEERDDLNARIETGIDICSIAYCNGLWDDAADTKGFASESVWSLVTYSTYFLGEVLEKILKAVVLHASQASILSHAFAVETENLPSDAAPPDGEKANKEIRKDDALECASALMHFLHPFALENVVFFLKNITRLRGYLTSHLKDGEHIQLAREILVDTLTSSCVDLGSLCEALEDAQTEVKSFADLHPDLSRRCLMGLKPPAQFSPLIQNMIARLSRSELIDRTRLFIKPDDLIDGFAGLQLSPSAKKHECDILTRELLPQLTMVLVCLRCKGKSDPNGSSAMNGTRPLSKRLWQSRNLRCVCGGAWIGTTL